MYTEVNIT